MPVTPAVNVGTIPDDLTGDPIRNAFVKYNTHTHDLGDLADVALAGVAVGEHLEWNGANWVNAVPPAAVDEVVSPVTVADIGAAAPAGADLGKNPANGDLFYVDGGGNWQQVPVGAGTNEVVSPVTTADIGTAAPAGAELGMDPATGDLFYVDGGSLWQQVPTGGGLSPLTSKGDLFSHNGTVDARLAVGTDGFFLAANSAQPLGIEWVVAPSGSLTLLQSERPRGGPGGAIYSVAEWASVFDFVIESQINNLRTGLIDFRSPMQACMDTGKDIYVPEGIYRLLTNFNAYKVGHPTLATFPGAIGLVDRDVGRRITGAGSHGWGGSGGRGPTLGNKHAAVMIVTSLDAYMFIVDDPGPGGAADKRGGVLERMHFKDISAGQDQVRAAVVGLERWGYEFRDLGMTRLTRPGTTISRNGTSRPALFSLPGTAMLFDTNLPGSETLQYSVIDGVFMDRVYNGLWIHTKATDTCLTGQNVFYGLQDEGVNDGTMIFCNTNTFGINGICALQHSGRMIHIWGEDGEGRFWTNNAQLSMENPIGGWSGNDKEGTWGIKVQGGNSRSIQLGELNYANRAEVDVPIWVTSTVPVGAVRVESFDWGGSNVNNGGLPSPINPGNLNLLDEQPGVTGTYRTTTTGRERIYIQNTGGQLVVNNIVGTTETWALA